jgi:hypothetical protein
MKYLIRVSLFFLTILLVNNTHAVAQSGPVECKIKYDYDVAGNRIKREYKCEAKWMPWDPAPIANNDVLISLSPNPTTGSVTGVFSEATDYAHVVISTMGGILILDQEYHQTINSFTIDISGQIPGNYLLTVSAFDQVESYVITKIQ